MSATRAPLANDTTRAVRLLLGRQCRACEARLEDGDSVLRVPARRVASDVLATALVEHAGVETLTTAGVVCSAGAHDPLRHVYSVERAGCPGWDGHLGVPLDLGADGVQIVPIRTDSLPQSFGRAAVEGCPNARWSR
jgi:hypothetical protein